MTRSIATRPARLCQTAFRAAAALCIAGAAGQASAIITGDGSLPPLPAGFDLGGVGQLSGGCSSVLLAGGSYLLASAHCAAQVGSTVSFLNGAVTGIVESTVLAPGSNGVAVNDLSLSKLSAPVTGVTGYTLGTTPLMPVDVLLAGYGSTGTGASGASGPGGLHWGYNQWETLLEDDPTGTPPAFYFGRVAAFDFDDGSAAFNRFGSTGVAGEAMLASGDSGGPSFAYQSGAWRVVGIHSAIDGDYGFGFGGISFDMMVGEYSAWLGGVAAVPEPASLALLLGGLVVVGAGAARTRAASAR